MARQPTFREVFRGLKQSLKPTSELFSQSTHHVTYHPSNGLLTVGLEFDAGKHDAEQLTQWLAKAAKRSGFDNQEGPASHYNSPGSGRKWVNLHFFVGNSRSALVALQAFATAHGLTAPKTANANSPIRLVKKYATRPVRS